MSTTRQAEFTTKLAAVRSWLKENKLGGAAFSTQQLFSWASAGGENYVVLGAEQGVATLLITPSACTVLANNIEVPRLSAEEFNGIDTSKIEFWSCPWFEDDVIATEIQRRVGKQRWASDTGLTGSIPFDRSFEPLTYVLTANEIARYKTLGKECSLAMEAALAEVEPGMSEYAVAGLICQKMWDHSVRPHLSLVASDERTLKVRHPIPVGKKVKKHLMAVLCGKRGGLIVSLTRMLHFGKKLPDDLRKKHTACCAVDVALNTATRPGRPMNEVFAEGVSEYERQGFADEWKLHHQGGPTGYQGRSFRGTPTEKRVVLSNQAYAWNPSITGTKSEDTILVHDNGFDFLSGPTKAWPAVTIKRDGKSYRRADIMLK